MPTTARTGFVRHPDMLRHDTGPGHPERAARVEAVERRFAESGLLAELDEAEAPEAADEDVLTVHPAAHAALVRSVSEGCGASLAALDADTIVSPGTWRAALLAAGGAVLAVDRVASGAWRNAFVACRPPGHHAERASAMGFCFLNNAAIAAARFRALGSARVAVVDFDVHHGNGTQEIHWRDGSVFYASVHQFPWYPGTGAASERGEGDGAGTTLNCPLPSGTGDREWRDAVDRHIVPALDDFAPDAIVISAGFDAHRDDPLSGTRVMEEGYRGMTESLLDLARRRCGGRVVSLLEGGYDLGALARSAEAHVAAMRSVSG